MLSAPADARRLQSLCIFCGSRHGKAPEFVAAARGLGTVLVKQNIRLVYGGGDVGLMGEIARTVRDGLGPDMVLGVIPKEMVPKEALMAKNADGFIAMPGGFGTLEEVLEVITWQQLGFHAKPIALLNTNNFYNPLLEFFDNLVNEGFVSQVHRESLLVGSDPAELVAAMQTWTPPPSILGKSADMSRHSQGGLGDDVSKAAAT